MELTEGSFEMPPSLLQRASQVSSGLFKVTQVPPLAPTSYDFEVRVQLLLYVCLHEESTIDVQEDCPEVLQLPSQVVLP